MSDFFKAAVPEPFRVLGKSLRPLSLGHLIHLRRVESAFVCGGRPGIDDLALSVWICSRTFQGFRDDLSDPNFQGTVLQWQESLDWSDPQSKFRLFAEYIEEGRSIPPHQYPQNRFAPIDAPEEQMIKVALMMETTLTESEIMDRPWALCLWDFLTIKAIKGQISFLSEQKLSDYEEAQKAADEFAARLEKAKCQPDHQ